MRAAIYDPYLDTVGGGERYLMGVSAALVKEGWQVDLEWPEKQILNELEQRLGVNSSGVRVVASIKNGEGYDFVFWLSDGSIPQLYAGKNVLHFQTPYKNVRGRSFRNRVKFLKIDEVVCNSYFTKKVIDQEYAVESEVIYPPVSTEFESKQKQNIILSVGRFSQLQQAKRQDILVEAFRKMYHGDGKSIKKWRLIIIGGSDVGRTKFVDELKKKARNYPIEILENISFDKVKSYYESAKIFWSASGFGIDELLAPQRVEHFGITVVESMASGCVPIVTGKGGHKEIIQDGVNGYLWGDIDQLVIRTLSLIENERRLDEIGRSAKRRSSSFSEKAFAENILKILP